MATFADTTTAITARMQSYWTLSPVVYGNTGAFRPAPEQDFVEFSVVEADAMLTSFPVDHARSTRTSGLIVLLIYVGRGRGELIARQYGDAFAAIFRPPVAFSGVHLRAMKFVPLGQYHQHWTAKAMVPFFVNTSP